MRKDKITLLKRLQIVSFIHRKNKLIFYTMRTKLITKIKDYQRSRWFTIVAKDIGYLLVSSRLLTACVTLNKLWSFCASLSSVIK